MALHNFVREHDDEDEDFIEFANDEVYVTEGHGTNEYTTIPEDDEDEPSDCNMNAFRDDLAYALYN